jgi:perosamine synthetase
MTGNPMERRQFIQATAAAAATLALGARRAYAQAPAKPALLGGTAVRTAPFPQWPQIDEGHEQVWMDVLRERGWFRGAGKRVEQFEEHYAKTIGTKYCLATANGTSALFASLNALDIGPGDEVIVPPYTFVATINVVLLQHAIPVFVDTDPATFQIDAAKIEDAITERTRAMIPVHLGGNVADLDAILAISKKHNIPVIEDACQSHLAEWRGKRVGSLGDTGCFSFQVTKNLSSGEGGAMTTDREDLMGRAYSFHGNGRPWQGAGGFAYVRSGTNIRMTEFQGALLAEQLTRLDAQSQVREHNAERLTKRLEALPGIRPAQHYDGCTRNAYHLYMFRYDADAFDGLSRSRFLEALRAEGIPASAGYSPLNQEAFIRETLNSRGYANIYPRELIQGYSERNRCPENDRLCTQAVWLTQNMLLGPPRDMDDIADAIEKIHANAAELKA